MNVLWSYLMVNCPLWHNWCLCLAIGFMLIAAIEFAAYLLSECEEGDEMYNRIKNAFKRLVMLSIVFWVLTMLIPSEKRITAMILLNESSTCEEPYNFVPVADVADVGS